MSVFVSCWLAVTANGWADAVSLFVEDWVSMSQHADGGVPAEATGCTTAFGATFASYCSARAETL